MYLSMFPHPPHRKTGTPKLSGQTLEDKGGHGVGGTSSPTT